MRISMKLRPSDLAHLPPELAEAWWRLPNKQLAEMLGCTTEAIRKAKKEYEAKKATNG